MIPSKLALARETRTVQLHEKREWFLHQILMQKDGLTG